MNKYEVLYILDSKVEGAQKDALIEKFSALVTDNGGEVEGVDKWGDRKLAYPINYKTEGYYVLMNFTAKPEFPQELERQMRIADEVIRYMVVKK